MKDQDDWADQPTPQVPGSRIELIRCGAGSLPPLIALNARHKGRDIHFWRGRSYPHFKEKCPACDARNISVWKGYLGVWSPATRLVSIIEFTLPCVSALDAYYLAHQTLRGAEIRLKRAGTKNNGALSIAVTRGIWGADQLPVPPDVAKQLELLWDITHLKEDIAANEPRPVVEPPANTAEVLTRRNQRAALGDTADIDQSDLSLSSAMAAIAARGISVPTSPNGKHPK